MYILIQDIKLVKKWLVLKVIRNLILKYAQTYTTQLNYIFKLIIEIKTGNLF